MKRKLLILSLTLLMPLLPLKAASELFLGDVSFTTAQTGEMALFITNASDITAFQFVLELPDGIRCESAHITNRATDSHRIAVSQRQDGRWFVGCWSSSDQPFTLDYGPIGTLTLSCSGNNLANTYEVAATEVLLLSPDGSKSTSTASVTLHTDAGASNDKADGWISPRSPGQAYRITNNTATLMLKCNATTGKLTAVTLKEPQEGSLFFIEPALDRDDNTYYLRSRSGYVLSSLDTKTNTLTAGANTPLPLRVTETGESEYGFCIANDDAQHWMTLPKSSTGTPVTAGTLAAASCWHLERIDAACPNDYLKHLLLTASTAVGLTQSSADLELRRVIHILQRASEKGDEVTEADSLINALTDAVKAARRSFREGDTSIADVPWGDAEDFPNGDYAVFVEDNDQYARFLSSSDDTLSLEDVPSAFTYPIKDLFYNPLTDRYAIRLSGEETSDEGCYLTCNDSRDTLLRAARSEGEALRIWGIMPLTEAIEKFTTVKGKCGTNITWRYDAASSTLLLSGTGRTSYYTAADKTPWHLYAHLITHIVLAGDIQQLGTWLFAGCTALQRLTVTAKTPAAYESNTFDGVPAGLLIRALNPSGYTHYIEGCDTQYIATLQDTYTYTGQPAEPVAVCDFPATIQVATMKTEVGDYTASASFSVAIEGKTYTFTATCPYSIKPARLIASTREYSKTYGATNPTFYLTLEGFIGTDSEATIVKGRPTITCLADKRSPVGDYPITISGGELKDKNYTWDYRPSVLHVKEARLLVIANDTTRVEGDANPVFTFRCSGFVNDEDERVFDTLPLLTTDADEDSAPGDYEITISGGHAQNYYLRYNFGTLTVTPSTALILPERDAENPMVYDLMGRPVGTLNALSSHLQGIYLINGNKIRIE